MKLLLLMPLLLMVQVLWAQVQVTGKVVDPNDQPIVGATIKVKGANVNAVSGVDGSFSISAPQNGALVVSYVGYQNVEVAVSASPLTVRLTPVENSLSEVVVTGYTTVQRKKFAGATASVPPAEIRRQPFGSFDQALQGQASGISVVANSGQPGASAQVRIRGNGSINGGNVPLYIMDGIEISAADFASLNQGDFERVEVLKDAAATAMYGSRGSNGVIVISTRRGRAGQLQLTYDAQLGFSQLPKDRLEVMNSRQKIDYEMGRTFRPNPYGWSDAEADSLRNVNFNWQDALFQKGMTHQHMLSAAGGSQTSRMFASLSYLDQEGIVKTTGLKRYTARINVDNTINNFRFGVNLQGGFSRINNTSEGNTFLSSPLNAIRWANPYERAINPNTGEYQQTPNAQGQLVGELTSGQPNPAMELFLNKNSSNQLKGIAVSYLEFHFPFAKGLSARTNWGIDYTQNETSAFTSPRTSTGLARQGILTRAFNRNFRYTGTTSLNYKATFGEHELDAGLFTEVVKGQYRNMGFTGYGLTNGFENEAGITPGSTTNPNYIPSVGGNGTSNGILSYFSIINYGYAGKYYATLVGRRDGSSRFGVNRRFANFGSIGFTWVPTEEAFMEGQNIFNDLRLRASIGTTGNQTSPPAGDFPIPTFGRISYAGTTGWGAGQAIGQPGNLDYTWEQQRTINVGVDFSVLRSRLSGSVEFYDRLTGGKDKGGLFYDIPRDPSGNGYTSFPSNFGQVRNRGVELMLRGDVIRTRDFTWNIQANITYNKNRIVTLPQDSLPTSTTFLAEDHPINSLYLVRYAGVDPATGNALYYKRDGSITPSFSVGDRVYVGTPDAPWYGGISSTVSYKGLDLSAQLNFFLDRVMYNNDLNSIANPSYYFDNMWVGMAREWRKPGDITDVPRPSAGAVSSTGAPANPYQTATTRFLDDASYWRLRNVTLGYTLPASLVSKAKIRTVRVFVQGQNWWTKTDYRSFDPEATGTSLVGAQYPALVQTTFGLTVGF